MAKPLDFEHPYQHTLEAFDRLSTQARQDKIAPRDALKLAGEMLSHGHPDMLRVTAQLKENPHRDIVAVGVLLEKIFEQLRRRIHIEGLNRKQLARAYRKDGYLLFESPQKSGKLLVVFTTIFNNFYISHLNLYGVLKDLGCHLLLLKETTLANYQRGVASFASDFPGIADQICAAARRLGADQIYLSGFSSSGYAALLTSLALPCQGYLGFSQNTDLSPHSNLSRPWFLTDEVYSQLDPRWLIDLRPRLADADPRIPRILCYGSRSIMDTEHALNLAGLASVRLVRLHRSAHNTIQFLLAKGRLTAAFSALVADR